MGIIHTSYSKIDELFEKYPVNEISISTFDEYLLTYKLVPVLTNPVIKLNSNLFDKIDNLEYTLLEYIQVKTELSLPENQQKITKLRKICEEYFCKDNIDYRYSLKGLALRICKWSFAIKKLSELFKKIDNFNEIELMQLIQAFTVYHMYNHAIKAIERLLDNYSVKNYVDKIFSIFLQSFLNFQFIKNFESISIQIHNIANIFPWILITNLQFWNKYHNVFILIFNTLERPYLISNFQFICDEGRILIGNEFSVYRIEDHFLKISSNERLFGYFYGLRNSDSSIEISISCSDCICKSRFFEIKLEDTRSNVVLVPNDYLLIICYKDCTLGYSRC